MRCSKTLASALAAEQLYGRCSPMYFLTPQHQASPFFSGAILSVIESFLLKNASLSVHSARGQVRQECRHPRCVSAHAVL